jgi:hypothetical protein
MLPKYETDPTFRILDLSLKLSTMFCLRVVPTHFLRDMRRGLSASSSRTDHAPKTPYYSPMLHKAIFAMSAIFSDDSCLRDPKTRRDFATAAKNPENCQCLETECQKPEINLVHALGITGTCHGNEGDQILADVYLRTGECLFRHEC